MSDNLLPDSRMQSPTAVVRMVWGEWGRINMQPIFCANCGKLGGYCPVENMTFAFWLCDHPCADQWGILAGTYTSPDEVFWERVNQEANARKLALTEQTIKDLEQSSCNSLSTLLRESPLRRA